MKEQDKKSALPSSLKRKYEKTLGARVYHHPLRELTYSQRAIRYSDPFRQVRESMQLAYFNSPLEELRRSMRAIQISDPLREVRESMKLLQSLDPFKELRQSIRNLQAINPLKELQERLKTVQLSDPLQPLREAIENIDINIPFKEIAESLKAAHSTKEIYTLIFGDSTPKNAFEDTYREVLSNIIIAEHDTEGDTDNAVTQTMTVIEEGIARSPRGKVSFEFYLSILISFLFLVYSLHLSQQSENRIIGKIDEIGREIIKNINEATTTEKETYYVVVRAVKLREKPSTKNSKVLNILYPNQLTRLVERKGKWIRVEYLNNISGVYESGWCYKKYLKMVKK